MTTLITRLPLEPLSMSSIQSGSRRHSARLQQKDDAQSTTHGRPSSRDVHSTQTPKTMTGVNASRKRKNLYDEEDDGFTFARVKKKNPRSSSVVAAEPVVVATSPKRTTQLQEDVRELPRNNGKVPVAKDGDEQPATKKRRNRMSFSTPAAKSQRIVRRSKRLSNEAEADDSSPRPRVRQKDVHVAETKEQALEVQRPLLGQRSSNDAQSAPAVPVPQSPPEKHAEVKISLPFADTPVISRNKAMREGKHKTERRSSLGLRGRRASSLLDSGSSSALPHAEVSTFDFYKHIESGLMEPRRMRLLLTWCATRAMHPKPQGTSFEDASAKSAARVIEEELLKAMSDKSELSDWFNREDVLTRTDPLPERPHPKNVQNASKITELEEQIKRLRAEKEGLEILQKTPSLPPLTSKKSVTADIDRSLLSDSDEALLNTLNQSSTMVQDIAKRVQSIYTNIRPAVDTFADGVHKISQYRNSADGVAGRVLSLCAERLDLREKEGRKKALHSQGDRSPGRDLSSVLRGLSKADR